MVVSFRNLPTPESKNPPLLVFVVDAAGAVVVVFGVVVEVTCPRAVVVVGLSY